MPTDYNNIPANACTFRGAVEIRDNGDGSTTAPITLLARSSQPIEHWYWGNVVHDLSGAFGKDRITLDYNHGEEIGYSNKREIREDGLHLSGALVSVKEDDTAHTVMKRAHAGIPYEASINFGGDGIKVEEVSEGATAQVNGYEFAGPGVIVREWPLRGCAVCSYGADGNTESNIFSSGTKISAQLITPTTEASEMSQPENTEANEGATPVELAKVEAAEVVETAEAVELSQAVEEEAAEVIETVEAAEPEAAEQEEVTSFTAQQVQDMVTEFGSEIALQVVTNGGTIEDARRLSNEARDAELVELRKQVAEFQALKPAKTGTSPASFSSNDSPGKPAKKNINDAAMRRTV